MYYRDRDRLLLSLLLTLGFYGVLFLILGTFSWDFGPVYPERQGPVLVTLEPRESVPVQPTPPREEKPLPEPEPEPAAAKPRASSQSSSASSAPPAAPPPARSVVSGDRAAFTEPRPLQSEGPGEAPPIETWESGTFEEEAPLDIRGENRIIYSEETTETPYGTPGEESPAAEEPADDEFSLDDFNLDRALQDSSPDETAGAGSGGSSPAGETPGTGTQEQFTLEFNDPGTDRRLLSWKEPEISSDMTQGLPPRAEVVIEFTITGDGIVSGPRVIKSSGSGAVDNKVASALWNWLFEKAADPDILVKATVRYVIQTR